MRTIAPGKEAVHAAPKIGHERGGPDPQRGVQPAHVGHAVARTPDDFGGGALGVAPVTDDPVAHARKATERAARDVATLEEANRSRDVIRAVWLRKVVQRFVVEAPALLTTARDQQLEGRMRDVVERAHVALDNAPQISPEAMEAAQHGDHARWNAELAPWLAQAEQGGAHVDRSRQMVGAEGNNAPAVGTLSHPEEAGLGDPLPSALRSELEPALGASLSQVRIHTDAASATAASGLHARAFAKGQHIHFGAGEYDPSSVAGRHLIAHEVAHTVQQQGAAAGVQCMSRVSERGDAAEVQAERFAHAFVAGGSTQGLVTVGMQPAATIHRYGRDEHAALSTTYLIELYDHLRTPEGKKWAKDHGYPDPEALIKRIEADPVVKTHNEPLKPGETERHVAKLRGKSTQFSYGELTALMGDLFGKWESLYNASETQRHHLMGEDSTASNQKHTNGEYLRLAANNDSHFANKNQQAWEALHVEAIQVAMNAGKDDMEFNRALFIEAASTHFLTDAFSAGHQFEKGPVMAAIIADLRKNPLVTENKSMQLYVGIADMADSTNVANLMVKAIHDRMNLEGFEVTNGKGMKWRTIGDGYLSRSPETQRIAALAVFESRQQIFEARGAKKKLEDTEIARVRAFFPDAITRDNANLQAMAYIPEARRQVEQILYHERKEAKSKLGDVGGYLVEHNLEAIGDPLRERNILQQQDFDRRQGGPGTAVNPWFQWRLGK